MQSFIAHYSVLQVQLFSDDKIAVVVLFAFFLYCRVSSLVRNSVVWDTRLYVRHSLGVVLVQV